ncbi:MULTISPECIES: hypothetical protein [unclassified Nocardioides]|uniref:hypothetical protein n=1 Tax=unclassified Nocardioides TaxID=2615069 RepID=UPI0006FC4DC0|nr:MULTISPECIES: hypothetical protein [unclassified Nocardioides]KRA30903.1 hypothetical protein ASD81_15480 [Nocardioides sp. Root614]KRA87524.1 hypothetical protein ASD84_15755 [Nocardioides sp. Root682]
MPFELTSAFLLMVLACFCAVSLMRPAARVQVAGPDVEEWRSAALEHFHQHKVLERTVAEVLATPGAVSGRARTELTAAVGLRVDTFA